MSGSFSNSSNKFARHAVQVQHRQRLAACCVAIQTHVRDVHAMLPSSPISRPFGRLIVHHEHHSARHNLHRLAQHPHDPRLFGEPKNVRPPILSRHRARTPDVQPLVNVTLIAALFLDGHTALSAAAARSRFHFDWPACNSPTDRGVIGSMFGKFLAAPHTDAHAFDVRRRRAGSTTSRASQPSTRYAAPARKSSVMNGKLPALRTRREQIRRDDLRNLDAALLLRLLRARAPSGRHTTFAACVRMFRRHAPPRTHPALPRDFFDSSAAINPSPHISPRAQFTIRTPVSFAQRHPRSTSRASAPSPAYAR